MQKGDEVCQCETALANRKLARAARGAIFVMHVQRLLFRTFRQSSSVPYSFKCLIFLGSIPCTAT
jgi:hypothetical protein